MYCTRNRNSDTRLQISSRIHGTKCELIVYRYSAKRLIPVFDRENPLVNEKGQVTDKAALWDRLITELNDAGEFQVRSHFSNESQDSDMAVLSQQVQSQRSPLSQLGVDMPQGSIQRSQGRRENVFNLANRMEGMNLEQKEKIIAERKGNADASVQQGLRMRQTMEKSMRMGGTGATASASRYVSRAIFPLPIHRFLCCSDSVPLHSVTSVRPSALTDR